jgi:hypothetical protein
MTMFDGVSIQGHADFNHATIADSARFRGAEFSDRAIFYAVNFGYAAFQKAVFADAADFDHAHFHSWVDFEGAKFSSAGQGPVNLHYRFREENEELEGPSRRLWHGASFRAATFSRRVDFENVVFSASSSFSNATFETEPPLLLGASFHEGTNWRGTKWPLPKSVKDAGTFVDAYACLKLEMDRLKKHEDELDFFALELGTLRKVDILKTCGTQKSRISEIRPFIKCRAAKLSVAPKMTTLKMHRVIKNCLHDDCTMPNGRFGCAP